MRHGGGAQAPVARNPFASAPLQGGGGVAGGGGSAPRDASSPTGPMLGKGSELQRVYNMPQHMGHNDGINCVCAVDDRVYTGGRDNNLFVWRGTPTPGGGFELAQDSVIDLGQSVTSLFYDAASRWLFCGLWNGDIQAFCKDPVVEDRLVGHRRSVASIVVHSSVVVSGSNDGTVRLWTRPSPQARWQAHGQPINNPSGAVAAVRIIGDGLWVGAQNGITCFDLNSLQPRGTIPANFPVTGLVECQGYMLATFRNGDIKIYDGAGNQTFHLPSRGEHTSNVSVECMMHPIANKPMILCGQQYGYVTAYDLPDFRPRGSFVCRNNSDVKAILDVKVGGMFMTAGAHGDIMVWQWGAPGAGATAPAPAPAAANPFAAAPGGVQQAASPFAVAPALATGGIGGAPNDLMMG
mmetsp:Transcript_102724/g.257556  ORF Transcript_102724/g.257556 Transcript_102724/m.257556 type:complete len:408 (-) Transcript_102724:31-1254(-)